MISGIKIYIFIIFKSFLILVVEISGVLAKYTTLHIFFRKSNFPSQSSPMTKVQKKCYFTYEERKNLLEAIRFVDLVIPETCWDQKNTDVAKYHIDATNQMFHR
jgi:hypothetical protein